jgi:hypothetical protein
MSTTASSSQLTSTQPIIPTKKEYRIAEGSLERVSGDRSIVVSYGYSSADWVATGLAMNHHLGKKNTWDWSVSALVGEDGPIRHYSKSGQEVQKIYVPDTVSTGSQRGGTSARRQCKAGLLNIIFHNYRMHKSKTTDKTDKQGRIDFVPVIFNIDLQGPCRHSEINKLSRTTCSEINFLRKLCTGRGIKDRGTEEPLVLSKDFMDIARKTIKFVAVKEDSIIEEIEYSDTPKRTVTTTYSFTEVAAPWESGDYDAHRAKVKEQFAISNPGFTKSTGDQGFGWEEQLKSFMDLYETENVAIEPETDEGQLGMIPASLGTTTTTEISTDETDTTVGSEITSEEPGTLIPSKTTEEIITSAS